MGDQDKETQSTKAPTLNISEEKQQKVISKIKELFDKENFKKNNFFIRAIVNPSTNAIQLYFLLNEKSIAEIGGVDQKSLEEILKKDELKNVVKFNPSDLTVAPTWKKLRNILYITNIDKELKDIKNELQQQIEQDIKAHTINYKLEHQPASDSIKITINEPNQEESITRVIQGKLFNKQYIVGEKSVNINCAIEEEQFSFGHQQNPQQIPNHNFKLQANYPAPTAAYNQQQMLMMQYQFLMGLQKQQKQYQKNINKTQGKQYVNKNGGHQNNNPKHQGNNLHQPSNNNNKPLNKQDRNNKGGKNGKGGNRQNSKQSQKVFFATEKDFPTLQ